MRRRLVIMALGASLVGAADAWAAAEFTISNVDEPGVGLNETTPATSVGGNLGTSLGEQRLNVFREAARLWGEALDSDVSIVMQVSFAPLDCSPTEGILGGAGPTTFFALPRGPRSNTWYVPAEANRLSGTRMRTPDIVAQFSASLDKPNCLGGTGWYYGLDHQHGEKRDLLAVALHEMAHGLGFLSITDENFKYQGTGVDVWSSSLYDALTGKHWNKLTSVERGASAVSGVLAWDGPAVTAKATTMLGAQAALRVTAAPMDPSLARDYAVGEANFGAPIGGDSQAGDLVLFPAPDAGCSPSPTPVDGKFAVIDRGGCFFVDKVANAQDAGAIGVIIVNNVPGLIVPAGVHPGLTIPVVGISLEDGQPLKDALDGGTVSVRLLRDPARIAGMAQGRVLMYAPNPFEQGSSVAHWNPSASPNLLMEPFLNTDLDGGLDLTVALFRDIDWFKTDLSLSGTATEPLKRGQSVTVTLDVANSSPSTSDPVTVTMEGVNVTFQSNRGDCATAFPCELGVLPAKAHRTITVTLLPGSSGDTPSARFVVASTSNYNDTNDAYSFEVPAAAGCGCTAGSAVSLGLLGAVWVLLGRRRSLRHGG